MCFNDNISSSEENDEEQFDFASIDTKTSNKPGEFYWDIKNFSKMKNNIEKIFEVEDIKFRIVFDNIHEKKKPLIFTISIPMNQRAVSSITIDILSPNLSMPTISRTREIEFTSSIPKIFNTRVSYQNINKYLHNDTLKLKLFFNIINKGSTTPITFKSPIHFRIQAPINTISNYSPVRHEVVDVDTNKSSKIIAKPKIQPINIEESPPREFDSLPIPDDFEIEPEHEEIKEKTPKPIKEHSKQIIAKPRSQPPKESLIKQTQKEEQKVITKKPSNQSEKSQSKIFKSSFLQITKSFHENKGNKEDTNQTIRAPSNGMDFNKKNFVGLRNPGVLCYINSSIQVLYHISSFSRFVFSIDIDKLSKYQKVVEALQKLFVSLYYGGSAQSAEELLKSFGWETSKMAEQQDVQEFIRFLIDKLDTSLKNTIYDNQISKFMEGKIKKTIYCYAEDKTLARTITKEDSFYDLTLPLQPGNLIDALKLVTITKEKLSQQYLTEDNQPYDAESITEISELPIILTISLNRFSNQGKKINSVFTFDPEIDLEPFICGKADETKYTLYAIIIHRGHSNSGHYYSFINIESKWYKFDDLLITETDQQTAIDDNFGGVKQIMGIYTTEKVYNAYILFYVRNDAYSSIFQTITENDIPQHLRDYYYQKLRPK